jgi:hypothetical protein
VALRIFLLFAVSSLALPLAAQVRWTETGAGSDYVALQAPASLTSNVLWSLPADDGFPNQCLATNGGGALKWGSPGNGYSLDAADGSPTNAVYVEAGGRVGIGTTAPATGAVLEINGLGTGASSVLVPRDTTANRPAAGIDGMIRYNTSTEKFEGYQNGAWTGLAGGLIGKIEWPGAANCQWAHNASAGWTSFDVDSDCPTPTVTGAASAPATKIPAIVLNSLPAGDYEVTVSGQFFNKGASCRWRISDGITDAGAVINNQPNESTGTITGLFSYASAGSRTLEVVMLEASGGWNNCYLRNSETASKLEIWVRRL